jgi:hypothetical protein
MTFTRIILFVTFFSAMISCTESPFLSRNEAYEWVDLINKERDPIHKVTHVVATINNDIYYFKRLDSIARKITNSPAEAKTSVKLSYDKTFVAYVNKNHNPEIIRSDNGQLVQTLTQYSYPTQIGWLKDTNTLFILSDREVFFYGTPPPVSQPDIYHIYDEVSSFSMNSKGDQAYFIHYYNTSGYQLKFKSPDAGIDQSYTTIDGVVYDYIDFYDNNGSFLVAREDWFSDDQFASVICVQNYNFYPTYEYSDELMSSPVFHASSEVLVFSRSNEGHYEIKAVYLGTDAYPPGVSDIFNKVLDNYTSTSPISLDLVN